MLYLKKINFKSDCALEWLPYNVTKHSVVVKTRRLVKKLYIHIKAVDFFSHLFYLDLRLRHSQGECELGPLRPGQIFGLLEGLLQREDLLPGERGAGVLLLAVGV